LKVLTEGWLKFYHEVHISIAFHGRTTKKEQHEELKSRRTGGWWNNNIVKHDDMISMHHPHIYWHIRGPEQQGKRPLLRQLNLP
jgi:hypothetical protein